jgi:hypothetical protein
VGVGCVRSPTSQKYQNLKSNVERGDRTHSFGAQELKLRIVIRCACREVEMDDLKKRGSPDRSKINMHEPYEVKYWTKELGVNRDQLQKLVDKVGNSAAAVRKELAT